MKNDALKSKPSNDFNVRRIVVVYIINTKCDYLYYSTLVLKSQ